MIRLCDYIEKCELRKKMIDRNNSPYCYNEHIENCIQYQKFNCKSKWAKEDYEGEPLGIGGADLETYERIQRDCSIPFITMPKKKGEK